MLLLSCTVSFPYTIVASLVYAVYQVKAKTLPDVAASESAYDQPTVGSVKLVMLGAVVAGLFAAAAQLVYYGIASRFLMEQKARGQGRAETLREKDA